MSDNVSFRETVLGRTGLRVGRLGVSGGFGVSADAIEMAFERGCNYFYHGSLRRAGMTAAIKNLCAKGLREKMVVTAQVYVRVGWLFRRSFEKFLLKNGLDHADVLLLGWYNSPPPTGVLDVCAELKEKGLFNHLAISAHVRSAYARHWSTGRYNLFHVRYNAAHRGAEADVFPLLPSSEGPGIVTYTATRWGALLNPKKMPRGERVPRASDCYRFALSNPSVNVCVTGPKNMEEMKEALMTLERGPLAPDEQSWMRRVGDNLYVK